MQLPKKAIITLAGSGTRFLPATKAVPKEMLPLIDKPIVQYSVEELVAAKIKDIILVVSQGSRATRDHFGADRGLERQLEESGKRKRLKMIRDISSMAKFTFIEQTLRMPYGNGTPLKAAADLVKGGPFFYLFGDDITRSKVPVCEQLVEVFRREKDAAGVIGVRRMPKAELEKYGVVKIKRGSRNVLESIVEKPARGKAPSDLAVFGRFLFTPKILPIIKRLKTGRDGELWLTDAIFELVRKEKVVVCPIEGEWMTTGDPLNYLKAMVDFALSREDLSRSFRKYIVDKLEKRYN